jgi:hypothetical protein
MCQDSPFFFEFLSVRSPAYLSYVILFYFLNFEKGKGYVSFVKLSIQLRVKVRV